MIRLAHGTAGGAALTADDDPNTTAPAAARKLNVRTRGATRVGLHAFGGTTCTVTLWGYSEQVDKWMVLASAVAVTPTTPTFKDVPSGSYPLFVQVTANTGVEVVGVSSIF